MYTYIRTNGHGLSTFYKSSILQIKYTNIYHTCLNNLTLTKYIILVLDNMLKKQIVPIFSLTTILSLIKYTP